jgi:hypothetical protein
MTITERLPHPFPTQNLPNKGFAMTIYIKESSLRGLVKVLSEPFDRLMGHPFTGPEAQLRDLNRSILHLPNKCKI